jgi:hypothetical protein
MWSRTSLDRPRGSLYTLCERHQRHPGRIPGSDRVVVEVGPMTEQDYQRLIIVAPNAARWVIDPPGRLHPLTTLKCVEYANYRTGSQKR